MAKKVEFNMETAKKYAFWVCIPIGLVVAIITGLAAVGTVEEELDKQKKQLQSQKESMERLRGEALNHPNQGTINEINSKKDVLVNKIFAAWQTLEKDQREQNLWEGLSNSVVDEITSKNFLDPLSGRALTNYLNFARDDINKLLDKSEIKRCQNYEQLPGGREEPLEKNPLILGSGNEMVSRRGVSQTSPASGRGTTIMKGKVVWNAPRVDITMSNWEQQPQSYEVWLNQEDLWIYQALLWVVAESNKNVKEAIRVGSSGSASATGAASRPLDLSGSVVKEIVEISIGKQAATVLERKENDRISKSTGMGESMSMSSGERVRGTDGTGGAEAARQEALAGRYVDGSGKPLMVPDLTGLFRRMPIYLRFVVDQHRISDILVNCANCPMPIDVLWVTINPDATQSFEFVSKTGTGGDSARTSGRGSSSSRGRGASSRSSSGQGPVGIDYGPDAVTIEIYGCINIFAPPEEKKIAGE